MYIIFTDEDKTERRAKMQVRIELRQGVGGPSKPIVSVNDTVKAGQQIALPEGLGSYIHSSINGVVKDINETSILIEGELPQPGEYVLIDESLSKLDTIKEAGIVGAGGAGFPTNVKLQTRLEGGTCYVNAAECEPVLRHNMRVVEEDADKLVVALQHVMEITGCTKVVFAIKAKHPKAIERIKEAIANHSAFSVGILPDMYPAGDERVIIRELHGNVLEPGQLPSEVNALVLNVETVKNIYLAIEERRPVITKDLTVVGRIKGLDEPKVFLNVPIGSLVEEYISKSGEMLEPHGEIIGGGPFTGKRITLDTPVTKTLGGIIVSNPFIQVKEKFGAIECECGAGYDRLKEMVESMGGELVASEKCKRMVEVNGRFRCEKPGECPGQTEVCLKLKKAGATAIIAGTCED